MWIYPLVGDMSQESNDTFFYLRLPALHDVVPGTSAECLKLSFLDVRNATSTKLQDDCIIKRVLFAKKKFSS